MVVGGGRPTLSGTQWGCWEAWHQGLLLALNAAAAREPWLEARAPFSARTRANVAIVRTQEQAESGGVLSLLVPSECLLNVVRDARSASGGLASWDSTVGADSRAGRAMRRS